MLQQRLRALLVIALVCSATRANASPINIAETATVSGSFGGVVFTNRVLTLSEMTDTAGNTDQNGTIVTGRSILTINLAGFNQAITFGTAFVSPVGRGGPAGDSTVGFTSDSSGDFLDAAITPASSYNLSTLATLTGSGIVFPAVIFSSTGGGLNLTSVTGPVTFAVTQGTAVPEPSSAMLCGLAGGVVLLGRRAFRRGR